MPYSHKILGKTPSTISKVDGITSATINKVIGLLGSNYIIYSNPSGNMVVAGAATSIAVPYPISVSAGDCLIIVVASSTTMGYALAPSGWTVAVGSNNTACYLILTKIAVGNEGGTTVTVTLNTSTHDDIGAKMFSYKGVKNTSYFENASITRALSTTVTNSATATSTAVNELIVYFAVAFETTNTLLFTSYAGLLTKPTSNAVATTKGWSIAEAQVLIPTVGSAGVATTATKTTSSNMAMVKLMLKSV